MHSTWLKEEPPTKIVHGMISTVRMSDTQSWQINACHHCSREGPESCSRLIAQQRADQMGWADDEPEQEFHRSSQSSAWVGRAAIRGHSKSWKDPCGDSKHFHCMAGLDFSDQHHMTMKTRVLSLHSAHTIRNIDHRSAKMIALLQKLIRPCMCVFGLERTCVGKVLVHFCTFWAKNWAQQESKIITFAFTTNFKCVCPWKCPSFPMIWGPKLHPELHNILRDFFL